MSEGQVAIRPYGAEDRDMLRALLGDPAMTRHLGGPESDAALESRHVRYLAADPVTNGLFTIVVGETAVGWVGFWEFEWEGAAAWECGWSVLPEHQRMGVATRAAVLMLRVAADRRRHRWMHAFPSRDNSASNALCRRLGFKELGPVEVEYPKGTMMQSIHWRIDLHAVRSGAVPVASR